MKNMKTRIAFNLSITLLLLLSSIPAKAQSDQFSIDKKVKWDGESKTETIYLEIKEKSTNMMVNLTGTVKKGKLEVTIYNPDGEKVPGFMLVADDSASDGNSSVSVSSNNGSNTVVTSSSSGSSSSNSTSISSDKSGSSTFTTTSTAESGSKGVMSKVIPDPLAGKWKIVISARKLTGELEVSIGQD